MMKEDYKRTLSLCFLKVTMPKKDSDLDEKKETTKDFKEMIGLMEQLLSSFKSIHSHKIRKKILGQDIISLEYLIYEHEIYFYVVAPKHYKNLIEKQINGFYPDAIVEESLEPNIFAGKKYYEGAYMYTKKPFAYPIRTYQKLESDPINNITNAFSKLEEDESAVLQILIKPINDDWQHKSSKISSKIMSGKERGFFLNPITLMSDLLGGLMGEKNEENQNSMYRG